MLKIHKYIYNIASGLYPAFNLPSGCGWGDFNQALLMHKNHGVTRLFIMGWTSKADSKWFTVPLINTKSPTSAFRESLMQDDERLFKLKFDIW